ncbi:hypothetical protein P8452_33190 [Trifolium repens]|nr:hypothetical protein P8452_33190 [Trifolium repens]
MQMVAQRLTAYCAASLKDTLKCIVVADRALWRTCVFGVKLAAFWVSFCCWSSPLLLLVMPLNGFSLYLFHLAFVLLFQSFSVALYFI